MIQRIALLRVSELVLCSCALAAALPGAGADFRRAGTQIDITIDTKPFTTYYFDPVIAKPYLMPLRTASGLVVTRAFPVRNDVSAGDPKANSFEPHQRPLYFGHGDIDGLDFWQEEVFDKYYTDHGHQAYGHVALKNVDNALKEGDQVRLRARFALLSPHGREIGEEIQTFRFGGDAQTRTVDCEFVLHATAGPLDIGDTKEGTFAIRLAPELSAPVVKMINSQGAHGEKEIWGKPADWVDYSGTLSGHPAGVAIFDSPKSFRHPTTWHARAYGLFAANPFGTREFTKDLNKDGSWAVPEGKSVTFRYRVLIHEGDFGPEQLREAYQTYAGQER